MELRNPPPSPASMVCLVSVRNHLTPTGINLKMGNAFHIGREVASHKWGNILDLWFISRQSVYLFRWGMTCRATRGIGFLCLNWRLVGSSPLMTERINLPSENHISLVHSPTRFIGLIDYAYSFYPNPKDRTILRSSSTFSIAFSIGTNLAIHLKH